MEWGDAVGQFYYHISKKGKYGLGLNLGMRSVYEGNMPGGSTSIGEGLSSDLDLIMNYLIPQGLH